MNIPPYGDQYKKINAHLMSLRVSAQVIPNMTVKVTAGGFWFDRSTYVNFPGGSTPDLTKPATNAKFVLVGLTRAGILKLIESEEKANPELPKVEPGFVPLAAVLVKNTTEMITEENIFDIRPIIQSPSFVTSHDQIDGREVINAHPISAITDLQEELDKKLDTELLYGHLAQKADINGTSASTFILNNDMTEIPVEKVSLAIDRGVEQNVEFAWNENKDRWTLTEDLEISTAGKGLILTDSVLMDENDNSAPKKLRLILENGALGLQNDNDLSVSFAQDQHVKASALDATPGYLSDKVDGTTIEVAGDKLTLNATLAAKINNSVSLADLASKVDATTHAADMAGKVDKTIYDNKMLDIDTKLNGKVDATNYAADLAGKASKADYDARVLDVDTRLNEKVNKTDYNTKMTAVDNDLANRVDTATHTSDLSGKVDKIGTEDIEITDATKGIILVSPNGTRHRLTVADDGTLSATPV